MFKNILIESYRAGLFQRKYWLQNIVSGIIVGVVALPLAMAFAIASGAKPEQGLYTAIVAGLIVSVFGGSRLQIAGPTGAFIVILSGITAKYGMEGLQIATLMAGFMLMLMGLMRLGAVIKFIPYPVILGFTAGLAVAIWVGQWPSFFGLPAPTGAHFHEKFWHLLNSFPSLNWNTTKLGILSLLVLLWVNKISFLKRVPAPLIALVLVTALQTYFHFEGVNTIGHAFGGIPRGLPAFHLPHLTWDRMLELLGPAFTIAMLGAIESLLSAVVADGMAGTRHHSNSELFGQGIANVMTPLFGGFAATGAIARTATNIRNGGNSPLSGIIHALTLVAIILFLTPLAMNVPLTVLAAILFVVSWNMSEAQHALHLLKRAPRADIVIFFTTFLVTIFVDLVAAVNIGVILAVLHFLMKMSTSVEIQPHDITEEENLAASHNARVYAINGPVFFGAVETIQEMLSNESTPPQVLVLYLRWVPLIDMTGINALEEVILSLQERGVRVMLCGAKTSVLNKLKKAGLLALLKPENVWSTLPEALKATST